MSTSVSPGDPSLTTPLKVWHVVGPMNHGGAEVMAMELLRHKSPATQVSFLVHHSSDYRPGSADFDPEIVALGARILPIPTPVQSGLCAYFRTFRSLIDAHGRPDVIHTHLNSRSGLVALAAWHCGVRRIIVHAHAALTFRGSLAYRIFANFELLFAKLVFGVIATDFWGCSREAVASQFAPWPSRSQPRLVINNAIDTDLYAAVTPAAVAAVRAELAGDRQGLLIGTVGRIVRHKNAALLVEILEVLKRRGVAVTLAIIGREADAGYCAEIRARAEALGLSDAVRFVGPRDDIPAVMAALDVFASPALREGFGLVGLEAQAVGTPSVLSVGFPSMIDMDLGLVDVPKGFDPNDWANAIENALTRPRLPADLVARTIARRGFSSAENTRRIERAWRDPAFPPGDPA